MVANKQVDIAVVVYVSSGQANDLVTDTETATECNIGELQAAIITKQLKLRTSHTWNDHIQVAIIIDVKGRNAGSNEPS